jgi:hypothetical protein
MKENEKADAKLWEDRVLKSWGEYKPKGVLKSRWELVQAVEIATGKKLSAAIQKTGFYLKDQKIVRGFPQPLSIYDVREIADNLETLLSLFRSVPGYVSSQKTPIPSSVNPKPEEAEYQ